MIYFVTVNSVASKTVTLCLAKIKGHFLTDSSSEIDQDRWHGPRVCAFARILENIEKPTEEIKKICIEMEKNFDEDM